MDGVYDRHAPKTEITLSLDKNILHPAQSLPGDLSERIERLLLNDLAREERENHLDATIMALNEFDTKYGSFADEHVDHL